MIKFDLDFKINVLHQYFDGVGSHTLAKRYGIARRSTVLLWVHRYERFGLEGLKVRVIHPKYSSEFKVSVLNWMKQQGASYPETALHFDISAPSTVWKWAKAFERDGADGLVTRQERFNSMTKHKISKASSKPAAKGAEKALRQLKQENDLLRIENAFLKKLDALARQKSQSKR
jgi:transposase-like protein